jgi:hypothetical protein
MKKKDKDRKNGRESVLAPTGNCHNKRNLIEKKPTRGNVEQDDREMP